ncbi:MAG: hypothetical protein AMXMBFR34_22210 [Myxococcaceae bacterium]
MRIPSFRSSPRRTPHGARHRPKGREQSFTVATINDDFGTPRRSNFSWVNADVMLGQETKFTPLRRLKDETAFGVHQNFKNRAKAGSSIVWKKGDRIKAKDRGYVLGVRSRGAKMLSRYINWTDLKVDGRDIRMVSVHRPPWRFRRLWPQFDRALAHFVKSRKAPIIVGLDANQHHPRRLARVTGLRWHAVGGSIDGFLASRDVKFDTIRKLKKGSSNHHPVLARVHLARQA